MVYFHINRSLSNEKIHEVEDGNNPPNYNIPAKSYIVDIIERRSIGGREMFRVVWKNGEIVRNISLSKEQLVRECPALLQLFEAEVNGTINYENFVPFVKSETEKTPAEMEEFIFDYLRKEQFQIEQRKFTHQNELNLLQYHQPIDHICQYSYESNGFVHNLKCGPIKVKNEENNKNHDTAATAPPVAAVAHSCGFRLRSADRTL